MHKVLSLIALAVLGSGTFINTCQADTLAIVNGTIIDATGNAPIRDGVLIIQDSIIAAVGSAKEVSVPDDAQIIDAEGKFLIPGLIDANLHLFLNIDPETLVKYEGRFHEIIVEAAQIALKSGLTTVFDTWGPYADLVKARDAINSGDVVGSRIYLAGNIIGFDGPFSADFREGAAAHFSKAFVNRINRAWDQGVGRDLMWLGPDEVGSRVAEYAEKEVDFLKYGGSGHSDMFFISFSQRVQKAIVDAAHAAGKTVQVHTTSIESLDMAVEAGVDILTHCDITGPVKAMPEATAKKIADRQIACSVLPVTQRRLDALLAMAEPDKGPGPDLKNSRKNIVSLVAAGATLLLSTDAGIEHPILMSEREGAVTVDPRAKLGEGHFNALVGLEEMGVAPMEILKMVTSNTAKAYKLDGQIGTLTAGKIADIVILDRNPLKKATNYRSIHTVIKDGQIVGIDALPISPIISTLQPTEVTD